MCVLFTNHFLQDNICIHIQVHVLELLIFISDYSLCDICLLTGLVPESSSKVAQKGEHQKGARPPRSQRSPPDVFGGTYSPRRNSEEGQRQKREKTEEAAREAS